jgi:CheY-specific phosphatase CheX
MDKRATERVPILGQLHGEILVFQSMLIVEISRGGATIDTRFPLQLDSLHDLHLTLGAKSVVVKGRVVHSRISDVDQDVVMYRNGMEFVELSESARSAVVEFLQAIKARRKKSTN